MTLKKKFSLKNPYTSLMIVKSLIEIDCIDRDRFENLPLLKEAIENEIDTDDVLILNLFGRLLLVLGYEVKTNDEVRTVMKSFIEMMDNPLLNIEKLHFFILELGKHLIELNSKLRSMR